jgi:hypothetical protein
MKRALIAVMLPAAFTGLALGQAYDGLTLYNTMNSRTTRLIDNSGQTVNSWSCNSNVAYLPYLMPDSSIWRPGVASGATMRGAAYGGLIEHYDWNGNVIESFRWSDSYHQQHHDIQPMTNGHVLVMSWDRKTREEAQAMGRQTIYGDMWPDEIVEYDPAGDSVAWEWHFWDHLIQDVDSTKPNYGVVSEHPELLDINIGQVMNGDWMHCNAVDIDEERDELVFCSHNLHEMYIIDHSTTTEEAAGHTGGRHGKGGDFLYRWGNPQNYDRGTSADQHFFVVHGANIIRPGLAGAGNVLIFNNGNRPGSGSDYSSVEEIVPPRDSNGFFIVPADSAFGPAEPVWMYSNPGTFYSDHLSGANRLPNGNTFAVEGTRGRFTEVTSDGTVVWTYSVGSQLGRAIKYARDFTGVSGEEETIALALRAGPNPFRNSTRVRWSLGAAAQVRLTLLDAAGRSKATLAEGRFEAGAHEARFEDGGSLAAGVYFCRLETGTGSGHRVETLALVRN